ncbi:MULTISPECIES: ABC transporter permease [Enterococcus]|jgi:putative ABC transport system permease protein|uniref:ABC transporter permease n=1 Tax=Enterococcus TaxID=1350 RepID=UPI0019E33A58|nr:MULTISPECIES: ABC transporter permease [Enterococcus]EGP4714474.1 ABC transporter permease [Enterococcus faecium]EGP5497309.1 ABC transporter permease [Enterococcus faecium]EKY8184880.1 ABC transporter permease [Enterococcus faecium]EME7147569.1 ABC transporter permease [Enterococcus faecium]EME8154463.1 ABC transporter permease [Enterococcus faecium]
MFLALNEIMHSKLRYALVAGVMFLIAYLVFFLTGLAYGLAQDNRTAVDKWEADSIVLSKDANSNLGMSMITKKTAEEVEGGKVAYLAQTPGVVTSKDSTEEGKINVSFFGIDKDQFIMPNLVEGKAFNNDDEAIGDISLKEEYGLAVGDTVKLSGSDKTFKLTGFTDHAKFNVSPVLYMTINAYQQIRFEKEDTSENARINAIVVRGKINDLPEDLEQIKISKFINELPGYNAQVLTFGFMIGFLIVIAAIVIGIFIYVLTMQKINIFGVMKAQGITGGFIARSVVAQTFILSFVGILLGLVGTVGTSLVLPDAVPFQSNWLFFGVISLLMLVVAVLGALFSVRTIVKIDPLKAIG